MKILNGVSQLSFVVLSHWANKSTLKGAKESVIKNANLGVNNVKY